MHGWTTTLRKAASVCFGCQQERGSVVRALSARLNRIGSIWLCTGCAAPAPQRQAFIDENARRVALPTERQRRVGS